MGASQSISVIGKIVTGVDTSSSTIAAGVCEVINDSGGTENCTECASNSLKHYTDANLIVVNTRIVIANVEGGEKAASYLLDKEKEVWTELAEIPVVGHVVGLVRYTGDDQAGRTTIATTRSTLIASASVLADGGVPVPIIALTGLAADGLMAAVRSLGNHELTPVGTFSGVTRVGKSGSINDWLSIVEISPGYMAVGALENDIKTRFSARNPPSRSNPATLFDNYIRFTEVADAAEQIPWQELKNTSRTTGIIREYENPIDALMKLEYGYAYNFVHLADGTIRAVTWEDVRIAAGIIQGQGFLGHSSLVGPGTQVVPAGEIAINQKGVVTNID